MSVLVVAGIFILLFIVLREFFCWYFKINHRIDLQKEQNRMLSEVFNQLNSGERDKLGKSIALSESRKNSGEKPGSADSVTLN